MEQIRDGHRILVADIGGTHARFSLGDARIGVESLTAPFVLETISFLTFEEALQEVLDEMGQPLISAAAICGAGPVVVGEGGAQIDMTNCPWVLSQAAMADRLGTTSVSLVNDFAALAHALPYLKPGDLRQIGGGTRQEGGPMGVLGAGTGLGVAGLVPDGEGGYVLIDGEGGCADIAPANARELAIFERLLARLGVVDAETILSGKGIETLHDVLCELNGCPREKVGAAEIAARAATGGEPVSAETISHFTTWLGAAAANIALTMGASGGIYIAGGIVPRWGGLFDGQQFRARFEARGKMQTYLEAIPTYLVTAPDPTLKGLFEIAATRVAER